MLKYDLLMNPVVFLGLSNEDCVTKMRLLSLVDLASDESGKIPYTSIKDTLQVKTLLCLHLTWNIETLLVSHFSFRFQVNEQDVELWIVKAITAKLIECKMDQMNQVLIVRQVTHLLKLCTYLNATFIIWWFDSYLTAALPNVNLGQSNGNLSEQSLRLGR